MFLSYPINYFYIISVIKFSYTGGKLIDIPTNCINGELGKHSIITLES